MLKSISRALIIIGVSLLCGCRIDDRQSGCSKPTRLSQKDSDYVVLYLLISDFNNRQTNWIITITARTNN